MGLRVPHYRSDPDLSWESESLTHTALIASRQGNGLGHIHRREGRLRLVLLNNGLGTLPSTLTEQVVKIDPEAQIRNSWASLIDSLADSCCAFDVIIAVGQDCSLTMQQMDDLWRLRVRHNYSPRPVYFAISKDTQRGLTRYNIERLGGHFLHLFDAPSHLQAEIDQIRLELAPVIRSLPSWRIVYEGNAGTLRPVIYLVNRRRSERIPGSDRLIAALAVFLKNNGIARSLSGWQKILYDDPLFMPAGGEFSVPSISTLKMYIRRDFHNCLQRVFDTCGSGFCADRVIEVVDPGTHGARFRIRGEWEAIRR